MNLELTRPALMTLASGELVFSDSPEWRHETFARELIAGPSARTAIILGALDAEKPDVAQSLRETMAKLESRCRWCGTKMVQPDGACGACTADLNLASEVVR